ncbi:GNAT family N-acetyltransferase [Brachybacterium sp. NBEC-018]|uniref:GNAT family N-acetyltransferase n=1 Tax=Brachybacterium sp. NBEC-018 TaxID=2996004 RepID=UPI002175648F|nr:GNAT family N-acetyltransferase [Brachybacterium sp. NBEC-018]UVY85367.1 GNAT family N-acetyltransferase [Brachybacterium sp. NBEC-018]
MQALSITTCTESTLPSAAEVEALYSSVGWSTYTRDIDALMKGLHNSLRVVVARADDVLIGLARLVGDGATICYLQDVLVAPDARRAGVGGQLVREAFAHFVTVRQHVLITDEEDGQKAFYESLGFSQLGDTEPGRAFVRFAR